jgi:prolyl 4-hydroxylase
MVAVEDESLTGGGHELSHAIWNKANDIIQEWTGQKSYPTSVYGIRIYKEGAILATHVDRLPLVSSMIINVDQDVDEDWPLEVIGHDGKAHNITMQPGDLILYESHSILHGRPFALKGRFFANIFVHFAPLKTFEDDATFKDDDLSGSLIGLHKENTSETVPEDDAPEAAKSGNLSLLKKIGEKNRALLFKADQNDWQPIHEAAQAGFFDVIEYLVRKGADINAPDSDNDTPLDIAIDFHGGRDPLVQKLRKLGAKAGVKVEDNEKEYDKDNRKDSEKDFDHYEL